MIRIIKEGRKPIGEIAVYTITCPICGCEFECELSDFEWIERRVDGDRGIDCPFCHTPLALKRDNCHVEVRYKDTENELPDPPKLINVNQKLLN